MAASPKDDSPGVGADGPADSAVPRDAEISDEQRLREWARRIAAKLPPMTETQAAAVARIAARFDGIEQQKRAA